MSMTPIEKAVELYNKFDMIIYTDQDHKPQIYSCMKVYINDMINEHYFDEDDKRLVFWDEVKIEKELMENK